MAKTVTGTPVSSNPLPGLLEPAIIHEDADYLGIRKPHRLHSAPVDGGGPDLCAWLYGLRPDLAFDPGALRSTGTPSREGGLLHRLDFETAGLVVFAKHPEALARALEAQAAGRSRKGYRALLSPSEALLPGASPVRGAPDGLSPEVWEESRRLSPKAAAALAGRSLSCRFRPFGPGAARVSCLAESGAATDRKRRGSPGQVYRTEVARASSPDGHLLEVDLVLDRGFRHQIRAQFAWLGLPLVGDRLYGGTEAPVLHLESTSFELRDDQGRAFLQIEA